MEVGAQIYCVDRLEMGVKMGSCWTCLNIGDLSKYSVKIQLSKKLTNFNNFATHSFLME